MRSTREVLESHLAYRQAGDLEGDLRENYHDDVVLLSWGEGANRGKDGVRRLAGILNTHLGAGSFEYDLLVTEERIGLLRWSGTNPQVRIHDGTDSFVVHDGLIIAQTIAYDVEERG